ncbi:MAG TPA: glycosyltransferase family 2 protein [Candidatus Krumholzibacteriaceae bacterium]|nr:glycosyltransferase family 2 protein [Candidatus Krumholzibacteriaceae bacterium]
MSEASLVVPVHNEAGLLRVNTLALNEYLAQHFSRYEIILVENGSVDDTGKIAHELKETLDGVRVVELPEPCLGEALKEGVRSATHDKVVYFPIDLSVDLGFIPESVRLLDDYCLVVGSKRLNGDLNHRSTLRRTLSRGYHWLVRMLLRTSLTDTTCVKAYRRDCFLDLAALVPSHSQIFETELLVEAKRRGYSVKEVPVAVDDRRPSRQPLGVKVSLKLRDLLSVRLDVVALVLGGAALLTGLVSLAVLSLSKVYSGRPGFVNPYSYLISMLLVTSGFQIVLFGLLASLILQIRRSVEPRDTVSKEPDEEHMDQDN